MSEARQFLDTLTAAAPEHLFSYLWSLDKNAPEDRRSRSHWFPLSSDNTAMAERAKTLADDGCDVYFGVSPALTDRGPTQRVKAASSAGIYGLWADLDWAAPNAHQKMNLPPSREAIMEILATFGPPPTVLVDSGHGLQAWWIFGDFWEFENDEDRQTAAALAVRLHRTLAAIAAERRWIVDSVFDLSRVMRVPGTTNYKHDPIATRLLENRIGLNYTREDIEMHLRDDIEHDPSMVKRVYVVSDDIALNPNAVEPPHTGFMRNEIEMFGPTLDRRRPDLADQSASSYDLSLASMCAHNGWEDQDIVDLLVSNRNRHGNDLKRLDYYRRTISKAREGVGAVVALENLGEIGAELEEAKEIGDDEDKKTARRKAAGSISDVLGFDLSGMKRYPLEKPEYAGLLTNGAEVHLGIIDTITDQGRFCNAILSSEIGHLVPTFKQNEWRQISLQLRNLCVDQEIGAEATNIGAMKVWLEEYLFERQALENIEEAINSQHPFINDAGHTCIFLSPFRRWLWTQRSEKVENKETIRVLRSCGAMPEKVSATLDGRSTPKQVWVLPKSMGPN